MPKEPKPNFASFTKAELVKTVKKLDARQTKLLNRIAELQGEIAQLRADIPMPTTCANDPIDAGVVHVKSAFGSIDKPHAEDWQDANQGEVKSGRMFPWEKD